MKSITTTVNGGALTLPSLYLSDVTPTLPARQVSIGQFPSANPNWARTIQVSDQYVFVRQGTYSVAISLADMVNIALVVEPNLTWTPPIVLTQPSAVSVASGNQASISTVIGSEYTITYAWKELSPLTKSATTLTWGASTVAVAGTTLTSNNTNVSNNDTVKISEKIYTFKTSLTPAEGEVLIGADADASLLNLIRAINHTGTPNTDYKCAAAHPTVTAASSVTSHAFAVTPKALTTVGIYNVATAGTLKVTPTDTTLNGTYYFCVVTDNAGSYGLTNGSVTTSSVALTVT